MQFERIKAVIPCVGRTSTTEAIDTATLLHHWVRNEEAASEPVPGPRMWCPHVDALLPGGHIAAIVPQSLAPDCAIALRLAGLEVREVVSVFKTPERGALYDWAMGLGREQRALLESAHGSVENWVDTVADTPAVESVIIARKPFKGSLVDNVLTNGVGALHIERCRVPSAESISGGGNNFDAWRTGEQRSDRPQHHGTSSNGHTKGRWPTNVIHDGGALADALPKAPGQQRSVDERHQGGGGQRCYGSFGKRNEAFGPRTDQGGSAARYFNAVGEPGDAHATDAALVHHLCALLIPNGEVPRIVSDDPTWEAIANEVVSDYAGGLDLPLRPG